MSEESALKTMIDTSGKRLVSSVFDLITVTLYEEQRYQVINQPYWLRNQKGELERYEMYHLFDGDEEPTLVKKWEYLKEYVDNKMMYI